MPCNVLLPQTEQQIDSVVRAVDLLWLTDSDDLAARFQPVVYFKLSSTSTLRYTMFQSVYLKNHTTETVMQRVWSDILMAADERLVTLDSGHLSF